ncbi:MAG: AAA family ATPase, partial [Chloroflexota bacterium]|nr:AAA family ATPase [Chloroflexota bacterium]
MRDEDPGGEVQLAKVRPPVLRDETLERPRLLDWLQSKIHGRVVLVIADAGYGKTTLLADFSRRSRTRTLWYRLDESDREWTTFLRHLVAAGREHVPAFGSQTTALLAPSGAAELSLETVLSTLVHELASIAPSGAVLILDDFHVVDDSPDCRLIARELVARAPERMCIVFASRQLPSIPFGKLRAVGEVAVIATDSLRFDMAETSQLFNETYGRPLASDLIDDLARRTEGWIASLELVDAALRNRSPAEVGRFVKNLHGADHDLYDFLAEVVVGELPEELQTFLMATSILQAVTPALAQAASGREPEDVDRLLTEAERLTLLSRVSGASAARHRFHPLVREFLESRLHSKLGSAAVRDLHRSIAANAAADWRMAAHHYREAADPSAMLETLNAAIPVIMGNAQYASAQAFIGDMPHERRPAGAH